MEGSVRTQQPVRVERDAIIARPVEEVFARLTDLSNYARWMSHRGVFKESRQCSEGPLHASTRYIDKGRMGTFRGEVVEFEAPRHIVFLEGLHWGRSPVMETRIGYDLEPTSEGTAVHHMAESTLFGIFRFMKPMVRMMGPGERRRTVNSLKHSLEREK